MKASMSTMHDSQSITSSNGQIKLINSFKDISSLLKLKNQKYCTKIKSFIDGKEIECKNKVQELIRQKNESLLKDITYHKQLYLFSIHHLKVIPKHNFEPVSKSCRLCENKNSYSPYYKCLDCKDFFYCQKCLLTCRDKHPHDFYNEKTSMNILKDSLNRSTRLPSIQSTAKYNSKVMNKKELQKEMKYGKLEKIEMKVVLKNIGKEKWKPKQIYLEYLPTSEIREHKVEIAQECEPNHEVEVTLPVPMGKHCFPGKYSMQLALLHPNSISKFFGDIINITISITI